MLHGTGQGQPTQKVSQVAGQSEQLQPRLVILEGAAGELRPFDCVLPFLDPLLGRPTSVSFLLAVIS